ncbi:hypothetical protein JCM11641_001481 [Rhodosporidiobolus odoratus]
MSAPHTFPLDSEPHTSVIIAGAGLSGLDALVQLKRLAKVTDVVCYEKGDGLGGTWRSNRYPGASCDIPIAFYSFSFEPAKEFATQWPDSEGICRYYDRVVDKYGVRDQFVFHTVVEEARFSRDTGLWTIRIRNVTTDETRNKTANVFISAVGALSTPADPPFDVSNFDGKVMHSAAWDTSVDLNDKNVVVVGNGCSAAQIVPALLPEVKSLTQIARNKHAIVAPNQIPNNPLTNGIVRYVPGLHTLFRLGIFQVCEGYFGLTDKEKGAEGRKKIKQESERYIEKTAPEKYWDQLKFDFDFGMKRRIIDFSSYTPSLHSPKFSLLLPDTIASAKGHTVRTEKGVDVDADVIVLATGFKVTDYLFPLTVYNSEGASLIKRLKGNGVKTYLTSMIASYPNFFILMGPNSVTGHSSALFNTECTVEMMIQLLKPVFVSLRAPSAESAPFLEVTQEAEDEWYAAMREEMEKKVWEQDGGISWYVDPEQGKCTTLFPWNQLVFQRQTRDIKKERFVWTGLIGGSKPTLMQRLSMSQ